MTDVNPTVSIITLNVNKLNNSIKMHRLSKQIKHDLTIFYLEETHYRFKDTDKLKVKDRKRYIMQTATSRKLCKYQEINFKTKKVPRDKEEHFIQIKVNPSEL